MTQQTSPFIEGKYGWALGEGNWNLGMDENLLKFSYLFDRNIDGIVSSLPAAVNGTAYFNTTDNRIYFAAGGIYSSTPVPKWFKVTLRSSGQVYQFDGTTLNLIPNSVAYTDTLRADIANNVLPAKGAGSVGFVRNLYTATSNTVQRQLSAGKVGIFEYAELVTSRPNPADFSTWNWGPALSAALAAWGQVDISNGTFGFDGDVLCPTGSVITGNGSLLFRTGTLYFNTVSNFSVSGVRVDSAVGAAIRIAGCTNFKLDGVRSDGTQKHTGLITTSSNFTISRCVVKNVGMTGVITPSFEGNAFYLQGCFDFTISKNDISRTRGFGAVYLFQCYDGTISENDIYDTWYRAIDAEGTSSVVGPLNVIISNNNIKRCGSISTDASAVGRNGIFVIGVGTGGRQLDDYIVTGNEITRCGENGIEGHGTFTNNTIAVTGAYGGTSPSLEGIFASTVSYLEGNKISNSKTSGIKLAGESTGDIWVINNNIFTPGTNGIDSNYTFGGTVRVNNFVIRGNHVHTKAGGGTRPYFIFDSSGTRSFNGSCEFEDNTSNVDELQNAIHAGLAPAGTAAPTVGGWKHGSLRRNSVITTGQPVLWQCIRPGQFTSVTFDGTSVGNNNTLTAVTNISTIRVGDIVKSTGGSTPYTVVDVDTAALTVKVIPNFGSVGTFTFLNIDPLFAPVGTLP